jgi:hypothetical protein
MSALGGSGRAAPKEEVRVLTRSRKKDARQNMNATALSDLVDEDV